MKSIMRVFITVAIIQMVVSVLPTMAGFGLVKAQSSTSATPRLTARPSVSAVELRWTTVSGATHYDLRTWWDEDSGWRPIGGDHLTGTTYTHTEVVAGTTYYYAIRALNVDGDTVSAWSDLAHATPTSPAAPTLEAQATETGVQLSWTPISDATSYDLRTWWDSTIGWRQIGGDSLSSTAYTHAQATAGKLYWYTVRALDADGDPASPWSNYKSVIALPTDRTALIALYNATNGANWTNNTNWLSDKPVDEWYGVSVNGDGRVAVLYLFENQLTGSIPSELGNIPTLTNLYLYHNQLSGSIPPELGNLGNLEHLYLYGNQLSGPIPPELGKLGNMTYVYLNGNQLSGSIPPELGNLASLIGLNLYGNQLTGSIPPELNSLGKLKDLFLHPNPFSGCIPADLLDVENNDLEELDIPACG